MKLLLEETPGKVMTLLGTALASMAFLFVVSISNASFNGASRDVALADPFNPSNVVAVLDNASNSYASFLEENLFAPAQQSYAVAYDNIAWVASMDSGVVKEALGIGEYAPPPIMAGVRRHSTVAGATTTRTYAQTPTGFSIQINASNSQ